MNLIYFIYTLFHRIKNKIYSSIALSTIKNKGKNCKVGRNLRIYNPDFIKLKNKVSIGNFAWLNVKPKDNSEYSLIIGENVYIGSNVQINAWESVIIDDDCLISDRVYISDANHNSSELNLPIKEQGDSFIKAVFIGSGSWIGINVCILPGVNIGKGVIVGANSVVSKDIPDYAVVGGVPAKIIKFRN